MANYKPADFFVGVVDLLAIFLPGVALALWATPVKDFLFQTTETLRHPVLVPPSSPEGVTLFFITASLFLGHLAYGLGAGVELFWNKVSKPLSERAYVGDFLRKTRLIRGTLHENSYARRASRILQRLGHEQFDEIPSKRFCTILVSQESEKAGATIERLYGLTRFFRSFSGVFFVIIFFGNLPHGSLIPWWNSRPQALLLLVVLLILSFIGYRIYKHMHEKTVYMSVLALLGNNKLEM